MSEPSRATTAPRPTAGERARTLTYGVAGGVLAVPGVPYAPVAAHVTDPAGRPLLLLPSESAVVPALAGKTDLPATLRVSDIAPVPLPDRLRGQAWLHGWLTEVPEDERREAALRLSRLHPRPELLEAGAGDGVRRRWTVLALEPAEIEVKDMWGCAVLEPEEYESAVPDPLVAVEAGVLSHVDACHRPELLTMLRRLNGISPVDGFPDTAGGPDPVVRALALDRYGMWLRCSTPGRGPAEPVDLRVVFGEPVSDIDGLRCVYRKLFAGAAS